MKFDLDTLERYLLAREDRHRSINDFEIYVKLRSQLAHEFEKLEKQ